MNQFLWMVPAAPLLGAVVLGVFGPALGTRASGVVGAASVGFAAVIAAWIGFSWLGHAPANHVFVQPLWSWVALPGFSVNIALYLDPLSLLMMLVITIVGGLIHLFATEYLEGEDGYSRFFAYFNLFTASMLLLVLASDLLVLFIGWEGVGVCSYLLVGFWYRERANGWAAQKSFIVTRIADIPMLVGILVLSTKLGTLDIQPMLAAAHAAWPVGGFWPDMAAGLLLIGGLGKSAQVPLQTWLPDAMAGPTPVSALIHAATMVTAGVYLVVRTHALFLQAPAVLTCISIGAAMTLLLAAFGGLVQSDIKRVLAYSTMSQIGYMFLALGAGAWVPAMFHFLTHAVFKALLFLSAGAIAMRLHHEQNIFKMGGLWRKLPVAFWCFLIGSAALAALPVVDAGFFSKDLLLSAVWDGQYGWVFWSAGILGAFLTPVYIFRAVFIVFFGPAHAEISGSYGVRVVLPLVVLGAGAVGIGWLETPKILGGAHWLSDMLAPATGRGVYGLAPVVLLAGLLAPLAGVGAAYALYRRGVWAAPAQGRLAGFVWAGCGFDAFYDALFTQPFLRLARALRDDPVDLVSTGLERLAVAFHRRLRATQTGQIRRYAGWLMAGSAATLALWFLA